MWNIKEWKILAWYSHKMRWYPQRSPKCDDWRWTNFQCKWSKVMSQRETLYNFLYIKKLVGLILDLLWPFFKFELTQLDICGSKYNLFFSSIWCSILSLKSKQFDLKLETFDQTSVEYWNLVYQDSGPLDPLSPKDNRKF